MSIKRKVLAAATALTLLGGVTTGALTAGTASAATRSCGPHCIDVFSLATGKHGHPKLVLDVLRQRARTGQPVVLFRASHLDPAEDFTISFQGRVSDFYSAGVVTTWLALRYGGIGCQVYRPDSSRCLRHYPNDYGYEIQYTPHGVDSGLCVGLPAAARNGTAVSLQPCGISARTVWVVGMANSTAGSMLHRYAPLINGSQGSAPHLYVLTSRPAGVHQLRTQTLQPPASRGPAGSGQQWGADFGILH